MLSRLFVGLFALLLASAGQANAPRTFSEAKKIGWKLYARQSVEFYCCLLYTSDAADEL
ncbi:deoxyribonuclease, partial [Pseudomonas aeruginosa]|nr:deoxyribonuclease [Pseudomonas aeruginosa]